MEIRIKIEDTIVKVRFPLMYLLVFSHPIRCTQYTHPHEMAAAIHAVRLIPAGSTTMIANKPIHPR